MYRVVHFNGNAKCLSQVLCTGKLFGTYLELSTQKDNNSKSRQLRVENYEENFDVIRYLSHLGDKKVMALSSDNLGRKIPKLQKDVFFNIYIYILKFWNIHVNKFNNTLTSRNRSEIMNTFVFRTSFGFLVLYLTKLFLLVIKKKCRKYNVCIIYELNNKLTNCTNLKMLFYIMQVSLSYVYGYTYKDNITYCNLLTLIKMKKKYKLDKACWQI
ncbi:hypothetical protein AGLY_008348 [Aphis glycines]|uniref:Uncharacterized protein n=1 Tax=Aphis glycines TaxID=307491 RepID=A0A6G0TNU1_APHGL|nr:hypothetical protein AGLY_008348 [Aphis glycines]